MPYIGQRPSKGDENNFKILDDISSYTLTFDGSDATVVSAANDTITSLSHRFVQGQRVTYTDGDGSAIAGLTDATVYFIIKEDHNTIKLATSASNASNGVSVNITNVGSGSSHTLNAAFDGINTKFKATHTSGQKAKITRSAQLVISMNGVIQQPHDTATPSTGFGFDLDGTIVFSQAPVSTDIFWAHVLTNNNVTFDISNNDIDNFTGDGSTVSFNLSKSPPDNRNILVTVDGVVQYPNDPDGTERSYTVVGNVLTFSVAPALGTEVQVRHIGFAGSTSGGGGVTSFYGRTGAVVLKSTDNITVNDAAITGNATVTGDLTVNGTTTTLDTILRAVDKLEVAADNTTVGVAITQSGSGDILNLYDGATEVFSVADGGNTTMTGDLDVDGLTNLDDGNVSGVVTFTNSPSAIDMNDNSRISFGTSLKTSMFYNASESKTYIRNWNDTLHIGYRNTEIYHTNQARLTFDSGNTFSNVANTNFSGANYNALWIPASDMFRLNDNAKLAFGNQADADIYHNGSNFYIDNDTGHFYIRNNVAADVDKNIYIQAKSGENSISCGNDGEVVLFSNSISASQAKLQTTGHGVYVTGIGTFTTSVRVTGSQNAQLSSNILSFDRAGYSYIDQTNDSGSLNFRVKANNTIALRLDNAAQAIFPQGVLFLGTANTSSGHLNAYETMTFNIDTDNDDTNRYFAFYKDGASGAGTQLLKIEESGKMGLGVDPTGIFDIREDNNPQLTLRANSHADNGGGRLNFAVGVAAAPVDGNTMCSIASTIHSTSGGTLKGDMKFYTNGGDDLEQRMVIDSSGKIGIGENNPTYPTEIKDSRTDAYSESTTNADQHQLRINNAGLGGVAGILLTAEPSSGSAGHAGIRVISPSSGKADMTFSVRDGGTYSEKLRIHNHGQLELKVPDANDALKITPSGTHANAKVNFNTPGNGAAVIKIQGTERLSIDKDGNITNTGIATSYVTTTFAANFAKLDLRGTNIGNSNHYLLSYGEGHANDHEFHMVNTLGHLVFRTGASGQTQRVRINSAGEMSIGGQHASSAYDPNSYGNPSLLIAGDDNADILTLMNDDPSPNNGDYASLGFRIAGQSAGSYAKAAIIAERNGGYNAIDLLFCCGTDADATRTTTSHEKVRIRHDGIVLINDSTKSTSRPDAPLQIETGANGNTINLRARSADNAYAYINFQNNAGSQTAAEIHMYRNSQNGGQLVFATAANNANTPTTRLWINKDGNVGINDDSPDQRLKIGGNIELNAYDNAGGNNGYYTAKGLIIGNAYDAGKTSSDDRNAIIWNERGLDLDFATNDTLAMKIDYNGKVVFGHTAANGRLQVNSGNSSAVGDSTNPAFQIGGAANYRLGMYTTNEEAIIANKNGDDGIGFYTKTATGSAFGAAARITSDAKLKYGQNLPHAVQSRGFVLYPDNGSNNKTTIRVSGLVSGCFIFQMGYYNSAGQGEGGFACAVSGYMTSTNQYTIDNIKAPYAHANSSISGIDKQNSYFEFTITNSHTSYTGGGTIGIIGDQEMTITVTYSQ